MPHTFLDRICFYLCWIPSDKWCINPAFIQIIFKRFVRCIGGVRPVFALRLIGSHCSNWTRISAGSVMPFYQIFGGSTIIGKKEDNGIVQLAIVFQLLK